MTSSSAQNKRIYQLKQEPNPDLKRNYTLKNTSIDAGNKSNNPPHTKEMNQHNKGLREQQVFKLHRVQHQIATASLPRHQKIHEIQIFRDALDNNPLSNKSIMNDTKNNKNETPKSSFLPPINPSSTGSLKKRKKINFISSAVAALTSNGKGGLGRSGGLFSRSQSSSTPNSRTSSPLRRQSPSCKSCATKDSGQLLMLQKDVKEERHVKKSSSNPALAEECRRVVGQKMSSQKSNSKHITDVSWKPRQPYRRMSLPLATPHIKTSEELPMQKSMIQDNFNNLDQHPSAMLQLASYHSPQRSEPISDHGLLLFVPADQNFIQSQRIASRVRTVSHGPFHGFSSDNNEDSIVSSATHKKENVYEEIAGEVKNEAQIIMATSFHQSPSLSSSSSSSSFLLTGKNEVFVVEEKTTSNQKSLDDDYSSQEHQILSHNRHINNYKESPELIKRSLSHRCEVDDRMESVKYGHVIGRNEIKFNHHKQIKHSDNLMNQDFKNPILTSEIKIGTSNGFNPNSLDSKQMSFSQPHRINNIRLGSRRDFMPPKKFVSQDQIGSNRTLPNICYGENKYYLSGKEFEHGDKINCLHEENEELRRLRVLIWSERKNSEQREAEVERKWMARMEMVGAEARNIEQILRNQLQLLQKQVILLQDQLRKSEDLSRNKVHRIESSTQTRQGEESNICCNTTVRQGNKIEETSLDYSDSCGCIVPNKGSFVKTSTSSRQCNGSKSAELNNCKAAIDEEQLRWVKERNNVIEYQQILQLNYIQALKKNEMLSQELHQLSREMARLHHNRNPKDL